MKERNKRDTEEKKEKRGNEGMEETNEKVNEEDRQGKRA